MGEAEGNGKNFVGNEIKYLLDRNPFFICEMIVRDGIKFLGYRLVIEEYILPDAFKRNISMNWRFFW